MRAYLKPLFLWLVLILPLPLAAQGTVPASFLSPTNGGALDGTQAFSWSAVAGAEAYYLYVGTGPGLKDVYGSGEIQATSCAAPALPPNQPLYARINTKLAGHWYYNDIQFTSIAKAAFTHPTNGHGLDGTTTFAWTSVPNAAAYYLYVGTAPGLQDIYGSGETQATSCTTPALPPNQTLYARIHTEVAGHWYYNDIRFTSIQKAAFLQPTNGRGLDGSSTFSWTAAPNASAYYLYVGTAPGLQDVYGSGEIQGTTCTPASLPPNQLLYARINTLIAGIWYANDIQFTSIHKAAFLQPTNGHGLDGTTAFSWTSVPGATSYYLYVGTAPGLHDVYGSGETQATGCMTPALPPNQPLYARINTLVGGAWYYSDVQFTSIQKAAFVQPGGSQALASGAAFSWTAVPNASAYYLYVGTAPGLKDVYGSGETQATSCSPASLPPNQTLYARISTKIAGIWYSNDTPFTSIAAAAFLQPTNGHALDGTTAFSWTSAPNASAYYLYVGTAPGLQDVYGSGETQATSCITPALPPNQALYARINTKIGGTWYANDIQFSSIGKAAFIQPFNGQGLDGTNTFSWTSVPGAQDYYLWIGTAPGAKNLYISGETMDTSRTVANLPCNVMLYARIYTKLNNTYNYYTDCPFYVVSRALFADQDQPNPAINGLKLVEWDPAPNAQSYYLQAGTSPGATDLGQSGETTNTSYTLTPLPTSGTVYLRLYTKVQNLWVYYTDMVCPALSSAQFLSPTNGASGVSGTTTFTWTTPAGADAYQFTLGTTPTGSDLADTGVVTSASAFTASSLSPGTPYYARIQTLMGGNWYFQDLTINPSVSFIFPTNGASGVQSDRPFEWTPVFNATQYVLQVGTTLGGNDLLDTGPIPAIGGLTSVKRYVDGLPADTQAYARLTVVFPAGSYTQDVAFFTGPALAAPVDKTTSALWAATQIRAMADYSNTPLPGTDLELSMASETGYSQVTCLYYALALDRLLKTMNVGDSMPLSLGFVDFAHKIVKYRSSSTSPWMALDPMFGIAAKRASDGQWASPADIQAATLAQSWTAITYTQLTSITGNLLSDAATDYFDYPLLYLNVYDGVPDAPPGTNSPLPYLVPVSGSINGPASKYYLFADPSGTYAPVTIDGDYLEIPIIDGFGVTGAVWSTTVVPDDGSVVVYRPGRFVF